MGLLIILRGASLLYSRIQSNAYHVADAVHKNKTTVSINKVEPAFTHSNREKILDCQTSDF